MKSTKKLITTALLAFSAVAVQCASGAESSISLQVPFAFVVAGLTMPAGAYTVETSGSVVSVRGNKSSALVAGGPGAAPHYAEPGLIFVRRSGTEYLIGVQTEDDARSIESSVLRTKK